MPTTVVAVLGARGKTGRAVAEALAGRGVEARGLGRQDMADLQARLTGCSAAYVVAPNLHPDEPAYVAEVLAAARTAGVERVVYHSVASPYAPAMPHHVGKAVAEDLVRRCGLEWTVLQPCAYVQNFVPSLRSGDPRLVVPYDADARFGLVDLADVAEAAARVLLEPGHAGATFELAGPDLVSVRDVARAAAEVLRGPVPVERVALGTWTAPGLEARETAWLRAMFAYYDLHGLPAGPGPLTWLLGRGPSPLAVTLGRELA